MNAVEQDIWTWITEFIEVNNKFYDYKFPPCPFARAARLKGLVDVKVYSNGNPYSYVKSQVEDLIAQKKFNVRVMAFPYWMRWLYPLHWALQHLNKKIIRDDFYIQYGKILTTVNTPYFVVIVNKLSDVLSAHESLKKTSYYNPWSHDHYEEVVVRRAKAYNKYKGNTNEMD